MLTIKNTVCVLLVALAGVGCHSVTNLTPSQTARNASGIYPVELMWNHREHALRPESIKAVVQSGEDTFPMEKVPHVKNRWEALVPIPADRNSLFYKFKIDYDCYGFPKPTQHSWSSVEYQLKIVEKPGAVSK